MLKMYSNLNVLILITLLFIIVLHNWHNNKSSNKFQTQNQLTAHNAKAFVITCMDFRLLDDVVYFLDKLGYNNNYDGFILAGSSLGYVQEKYKEWKKITDQHIHLAKKLHKISEIIVIDYIDCGAYRLFYGKNKISRNDEIKLHKINFEKFKKLVEKTYPKIKISTYLMDIDGQLINY